MTKINWRIRFTLKNKAFLARLALAIFVPIITYFGLKAEDLTTWAAVGKLLLDSIGNPYVLGFTVINILNVIPDPTTKGLSDSENALGYSDIH